MGMCSVGFSVCDLGFRIKDLGGALSFCAEGV